MDFDDSICRLKILYMGLLFRRVHSGTVVAASKKLEGIMCTFSIIRKALHWIPVLLIFLYDSGLGYVYCDKKSSRAPHEHSWSKR